MIVKKKILVTTTTFPSFLKNDATPPFVYELSKRLAKKEKLNVIISTPYVKNAKKFEERDGLKIYRFRYRFTSLRNGAMLPNIKKQTAYFSGPLFPSVFFFKYNKNS